MVGCCGASCDPVSCFVADGRAPSLRSADQWERAGVGQLVQRVLHSPGDKVIAALALGVGSEFSTRRSIAGRTLTVIFAGSGTRPGRSSTVTPHGGAIWTGATSRRSSRCKWSTRAMRWPRNSACVSGRRSPPPARSERPVAARAEPTRPGGRSRCRLSATSLGRSHGHRLGTRAVRRRARARRPHVLRRGRHRSVRREYGPQPGDLEDEIVGELVELTVGAEVVIERLREHERVDDERPAGSGCRQAAPARERAHCPSANLGAEIEVGHRAQRRQRASDVVGVAQLEGIGARPSTGQTTRIHSAGDILLKRHLVPSAAPAARPHPASSKRAIQPRRLTSSTIRPAADHNESRRHSKRAAQPRWRPTKPTQQP